MKILFINSYLSFPRYIKRIKAIQQLGVNTTVIAYNRDDNKSGELLSDTISLGTIEHGKYFQRILTIIKSFLIVRRECKEIDICYCFGLDMFLLGWLASLCKNNKPKYVYEVGDIRPILLGEGFANIIARKLDRYLASRAKLLVVTSTAFITEYYYKIINLSSLSYIEIENKIESRDIKSKLEINIKKDHIIRIGYYGAIRCEASWGILSSVVKRSKGRIILNVYGFIKGIDNAYNDIDQIPGINYYGSYKSPDDLHMIHNNIDIAWIASIHGGANSIWAKRCRYYEAGAFNTPMIAQVNTQDGIKVNKYGFGKICNLMDRNTTIEQLLSLDHNDIEIWHYNLKQISKDKFCYGDEHKGLISKLKY